MRKKIYDKKSLVRLTSDELEQIHQKAKKANLSVSRFFVKSALSDGAVLTKEEQDEIKLLRFEIKKIGVNLNQIAYSINISRRGAGEMPAQSKTDEVQELIEETLKKLLEKL